MAKPKLEQVESYAGTHVKYFEDPDFQGFRMRPNKHDDVDAPCIRIHIQKTHVRSRLSKPSGCTDRYVAMDIPVVILTRLLDKCLKTGKFKKKKK